MRLHVTPNGDQGWAVKEEGRDEPRFTRDTQGEAERAARAADGVTEVIIHGRDGRIRDGITEDPAHESPAPDKVH
jgi:hypothetical protein